MKIADIIEKIVRGDHGAFRQLVEEYYDRAWGTALKLLTESAMADDAVQETFIKIWENRKKLRPVDDLWPYIRRVVVNRCWDMLRSSGRKGRAEMLSKVTGGYKDQADAALVEGEAIQILNMAAMDLSPAQRTVFILSEIEDMSADEISRETGLNKNTIKSNLSYARKNIKKKLQTIYIQSDE